MPMTSKERASHAMEALTAYSQSKDGIEAYDEDAAMIGDLIADLLHLARSLRIDPHSVLLLGKQHFVAEEADEVQS